MDFSFFELPQSDSEFIRPKYITKRAVCKNIFSTHYNLQSISTFIYIPPTHLNNQEMTQQQYTEWYLPSVSEKKQTKRQVKGDDKTYHFEFRDLNSASLSDGQMQCFWLSTSMDKKTVEGITPGMESAAKLFIGTVLYSEKFKKLLQS